eukprot:CAMPEP_0183583062 /NCGR_PEP_ID=MMETSP0371-20130417/150885_1 /TAXON_ID=268820 /ORGANISM="Peridinium aciculiferum, Strain PAER-2" /LENGTH=323 /DNA_ID=CAMNT_0025793857 /DNA_START=1 /DNA_END=968 /DNA_ORIENTATION=-
MTFLDRAVLWALGFIALIIFQTVFVEEMGEVDSEVDDKGVNVRCLIVDIVIFALACTYHLFEIICKIMPKEAKKLEEIQTRTNRHSLHEDNSEREDLGFSSLKDAEGHFTHEFDEGHLEVAAWQEAAAEAEEAEEAKRPQPEAGALPIGECAHPSGESPLGSEMEQDTAPDEVEDAEAEVAPRPWPEAAAVPVEECALPNGESPMGTELEQGAAKDDELEEAEEAKRPRPEANDVEAPVAKRPRLRPEGDGPEPEGPVASASGPVEHRPKPEDEETQATLLADTLVADTLVADTAGSDTTEHAACRSDAAPSAADAQAPAAEA